MLAATGTSMKRLKIKRETVRLLRSAALQAARGGVITDGDSDACTAVCGGGGMPSFGRPCTWDWACIPPQTVSCATCQANSNCGCTVD